jgi:hypothetical protein
MNIVIKVVGAVDTHATLSLLYKDNHKRTKMKDNLYSVKSRFGLIFMFLFDSLISKFEPPLDNILHGHIY